MRTKMKVLAMVCVGFGLGLVGGVSSAAYQRPESRPLGGEDTGAVAPVRPEVIGQSCGEHRQPCGHGESTWCCDKGTPERPICCANTNGGCEYCFE
jgi:hypothetical protein